MKRPLYIIGTGKVATHLLKVLLKRNVEVSGIWGRTIAIAKEKANEYGVPHINKLSNVPQDAVCPLFAAVNHIAAIFKLPLHANRQDHEEAK
ncbi:MAG: hypothetical protein AAF193_06305, partial [Bacteroidota bacterium]